MTDRPLRLTPDEARVVRHAASNLRAYANEPFTDDASAVALRSQADVLDALTDDYPDDWPTPKDLRRPRTRPEDSATPSATDGEVTP
jgi:hypothetical protein